MTKLLEQFRNAAFWLLDALKGGHVRKHYKEIQWVLENPQTERTKKIKEQKLTGQDHFILSTLNIGIRRPH